MNIANYTSYFNDWIHLERYVNSGSDHAFKNQTDVPPRYRPGASYPSHKLKALVGTEHVSDGLLPDNLFPVHPFTAAVYKNLGHSIRDTNISFEPTSSTRTILATNRKSGDKYHIKLDLPVNISRFDRSITRSDTVFSRQINAELGSLKLAHSHKHGYFQEIGGGYTTLKDERQAAYIVRDLRPSWFNEAPKKYYLVPSFSLITNQANEKPILIQMLERSGQPHETVVKGILLPLLELWFSLAEHGLLWELQQQNTLFAIDEDYRPIGVVGRDFDGMYIDTVTRSSLGAHNNFIKHKLSLPEQLMLRYSLTFDHRVCKQNIMRIIHCYGEHYGDLAAQRAQQQVSEYISIMMPDSMRHYLPKNEWYTVPEVMFEDGIVTALVSNPPLR